MQHATNWTEGNETWWLMRSAEGELMKVEGSLHELAIRQGATDVEGDEFGWFEVSEEDVARLGLSEEE